MVNKHSNPDQDMMPDFVKVLRPNIQNFDILKLPTKFASIHRGDFAHRCHVLLRSFMQKQYTVTMNILLDGEIFLSDLVTFYKYHMVAKVDIMVFKYPRAKSFRVYIYTPSYSPMTEVEYASRAVMTEEESRAYLVVPNTVVPETSPKLDVPTFEHGESSTPKGKGGNVTAIVSNAAVSGNFDDDIVAQLTRKLRRSAVRKPYLFALPVETYTALEAGGCIKPTSSLQHLFQLHYGNNSWTVKLVSGNTFSGGWTAFAKENELRKNDVLTLKFKRNMDVLLNIV